jgi:hypothetical protein
MADFESALLHWSPDHILSMLWARQGFMLVLLILA